MMNLSLKLMCFLILTAVFNVAVANTPVSCKLLADTCWLNFNTHGSELTVALAKPADWGMLYFGAGETVSGSCTNEADGSVVIKLHANPDSITLHSYGPYLLVVTSSKLYPVFSNSYHVNVAGATLRRAPYYNCN